MARGNGEGTIYETVQKLKKNFDNTNMCKICIDCKDRSLCNERKDWTKCDRCKNCDHFYIYKKTFAQVSTDNGRITVANGKNKKEVNEKKDEKETEIKLKNMHDMVS